MSQLGIKSNTINSTLDTPITQGIKNDADSEIMKPRADLPPELQNARPSKRGILARIGAFLFGAGAAGGAAFGLGAGGVIGGLIGVGATAAVGIATGGAALIGGAVALGLYAGIKAIVNHFRKAPDPEPRLQAGERGHDDAKSVALFNSNIKDCIDGSRPQEMPADFLEAGNNACAEIAGKLHGFHIGSLADLVKDKRCRGELNNALNPFSKGVGGKLTPEQFGGIVRQTVFRHAKLTMLANKVGNALEKRGEAHDEKTGFKLAKMIIADPAMKQQFEDAVGAPDVEKFLDDAAKVVGDTFELDKKLPDFKNAALADGIGKLAKLLNITENELQSKIKLDTLDNELRSVVTGIRNGFKHATMANVKEQFNDAINEFIDGVKAMFEDFENCPVSDKQKGEWKMSLLNGRKLYPPQMHVIGKVVEAAANADVSALLNALKNGAPAKEVYEAATGMVNNIVDGFLDSNPDIKNEWNKNWGGDEKPDIIAYVWEAVFDKTPELLEAFSAREGIADEMNDLNMVAQMSKNAMRGMNSNIIGGLMKYLSKPR